MQKNNSEKVINENDKEIPNENDKEIPNLVSVIII